MGPMPRRSRRQRPVRIAAKGTTEVWAAKARQASPWAASRRRSMCQMPPRLRTRRLPKKSTVAWSPLGGRWAAAHSAVEISPGWRVTVTMPAGGWLTAFSCATLAGTNAIAANGGNQGSYSGGGGGGRIVLVYGAKTFSGPVIARGGSGYNQYGSAGTIYEQTVAQGTGAGTVLIDNNNLSTAVRTQIPPATNAVPDELKYASILVTNRGALAVTTNATVQALTVASATEPLDLGAADTVLTVRSLSVNGLAYTKGGLYTTNNWNGYALPGANVTGAGAIRIVNSGTAIMMR